MVCEKKAGPAQQEKISIKEEECQTQESHVKGGDGEYFPCDQGTRIFQRGGMMMSVWEASACIRSSEVAGKWQIPAKDIYSIALTVTSERICPS